MSHHRSSHFHVAFAVLGITLLGFRGNVIAASPAWLTAHDAEIKVLVGKMTLAEKAGQMTQPDIRAIGMPGPG